MYKFFFEYLFSVILGIYTSRIRLSKHQIVCLRLVLFWLNHVACRILLPQPGIEPTTPVFEAQSFNHWTAREVPTTKYRMPRKAGHASLKWLLVAHSGSSQHPLPPREEQRGHRGGSGGPHVGDGPKQQCPAQAS